MRKILVIVLIVLVAYSTNALAQEKRAQTGVQFLSVSQDARAAAMGAAFTTVENTPGALFYNPAPCAKVNTKHAIQARNSPLY